MTELQTIITGGAASGVAAVLAKALGQKALAFLSEKLQDFREDNATEFFTGFRSMVNPLGLENPRQVPPKIWYPIIDQGTLEDDEFLRTKYAALLANAVDPDFKFGIRPSFVQILKQLTSTEAKFIDDLYADVALQPETGYVADIGSEGIKQIVESMDLGQEEAILVLMAISRHGLLEMTAPPQTYMTLGSGPYASVVQVNRFGFEFVAACRPPSTAENKPDQGN